MAAAARLAALRERIKGKEDEAVAKRKERLASATASQPEHRAPLRELPQAKPLSPEKVAEHSEKAQRRVNFLKKLKEQDELAEIVRRARPAENFDEEPAAKKPCTEADAVDPDAPADVPPAAEVRCRCGLPPSEFTVRKEGPNQGRAFLKCPDGRCGFWEWVADGRSPGPPPTAAAPTSTTPSSGPPSLGFGFSGALADAFAAGRAASGEAPSVTTPPARPMARSMGFFEQQTPSPAPPPGSRLCLCGVAAVTFQANKAGPNQGRRFWKCGEQRCKFFEWDDEPPRQQPQGGAAPAAGGGPPACFRCGKPGHFSRDCQEKAQATSTACFKCGGGGHFARDCPDAVPV